MTSSIFDSLSTTDALSGIFSDASLVAAMLEFEVALARTAAGAGAIPARVVEAITRGAAESRIDFGAIVKGARETGTPAIALVKALTKTVESIDRESAGYVHWSATSQDVTDSAMVILLRRARAAIDADAQRLLQAVRRLSDAHAGTIMLGRTLLQSAAPITFGLKGAGWYAAIARAWARASDAWQRALVVQYGGAVGTRAAAGPHARAVASGLARTLGLAAGPPWHTDRDRLAALVAACGLFAAALGKTARDISLMMQSEVGEAFEPGGGSSAMPHKRNPSGCARVLAATVRMPPLVSTFLAASVQEHERAAGAWHAEWPTIVDAVQTTGAAASALADVVENLTIDAARMRRNLDAANGVVFAERAVVLLTPSLGRARAQDLVAAIVRDVHATGRSFGELCRESAEVLAAVPAANLSTIDRAEDYVGEAETLRQELLSAATAPAAD